jgi:hypothetical protein
MITERNQNLTETQAANYLGLQNRQTLANWRHIRKGPAYCRVGQRIIYRLADLDAYLSIHRIDPDSTRVNFVGLIKVSPVGMPEVFRLNSGKQITFFSSKSLKIFEKTLKFGFYILRLINYGAMLIHFFFQLL